MAQQTVIHASHIGAVYVSEEIIAFGTADVERRIHPRVDTAAIMPEQAEIEALRLRVVAHDPTKPVRGFKGATGGFEHYLQPDTTYLVTTATPDTDAAAPLSVPMRCILGGESIAAGATIPSGTYSTVAFDVTAGQGARIPAGQICAVDQAAGSGTEDLVPCRVRVRSTDAITVWPALATAPDAGGRVINSRTWYATQTNTRSMSLALAPSNGTALEYRATGGTGNVTISFTRGELVTAGFELAFATFTGPANLSLGAAVVADPMATPLSTRGAKMYLQPVATTTRECVKVDSFALSITSGMEHLDTLTCGVEGRKGVMRSAGLTEAFATIELVCDVDTDYDTSAWTSQTDLSLMLFVQLDVSASVRRFVVIDAPRVFIVGKPRVERGANNLAKMTLTLRLLRDNTTTGSGDLATAPLRIATI
jgi:hypothetical protein